ncbi:MAG: N(4)-(beta-N-acetylglucosaminyl)-L-asparaginase [Candidatus Omnitrophica bacterium]|nr:N(4)-(beta-N-acetylglucosaminyl)-L-asparaginase [Candidatus Omnitrophota bacterium]
MAKQNPIILSTWNFGLQANQAGWSVLKEGGAALDAVEAAASVTENDPSITSVGYGGYPNEDGVIQLDAAVIDGKTGRMGSVAALEGIRNPCAVARKVLEKNKHIYLVGEGAQNFALKEGFQLENLNTPQSAQWYAEQLKKRSADQGHDTIGVLARDEEGELATACTTSGLAMKWAGRVGDSPIIGAGLYLDGKIGGAVGTGVGERAIEVCASFAIVEFMRNGMSPQNACEELLRRVVNRHRGRIDFQLAFIALNREGRFGGAALQEGFEYAVYAGDENALRPGAVYGRDFQ